jgi:hypothetical protein
MFVQSLSQIQAQSYLKTGELVKRIGNTLNIDMEGLIKSDEEIQQEQAQAQQAQMAQTVAPNLVNQLGSIGKQQLEAQAQQEEGIE